MRCPAQPGGGQAGAAGAVDVPGVHGDQQGLVGGHSHGVQGVRVGLPRGLPAAGARHVQVGGEAVGQSGPVQHGTGGVGRAVRQGGQSVSGRVQGAYTSGHVRVQGQFGQPGEDVRRGLFRVAGALFGGRQRPQSFPGDGREGGVAAGQGEGHAVAQHAGEPGGEKMPGHTDALQAGGERSHVGECLVHVEQHDVGAADSGQGGSPPGAGRASAWASRSSRIPGTARRARDGGANRTLPAPGGGPCADTPAAGPPGSPAPLFGPVRRGYSAAHQGEMQWPRGCGKIRRPSGRSGRGRTHLDRLLAGLPPADGHGPAGPRLRGQERAQ